MTAGTLALSPAQRQSLLDIRRRQLLRLAELDDMRKDLCMQVPSRACHYARFVGQDCMLRELLALSTMTTAVYWSKTQHRAQQSCCSSHHFNADASLSPSDGLSCCLHIAQRSCLCADNGCNAADAARRDGLHVYHAGDTGERRGGWGCHRCPVQARRCHQGARLTGYMRRGRLTRGSNAGGPDAGFVCALCLHTLSANPSGVMASSRSADGLRYPKTASRNRWS